jgi:hypothetical protein
MQVDEVKISANLEWIRPFVKRAKRSIKDLKLPTYIRSNRPSKKRVQRRVGCCFSDGGIVLHTHRQKVRLTRRGRGYVVEEIVELKRVQMLLTLAHELAHLRYFEHEYKHKRYAERIFASFGVEELCPTCGGHGTLIAPYRE